MQDAGRVHKANLSLIRVTARRRHYSHLAQPLSAPLPPSPSSTSISFPSLSRASISILPVRHRPVRPSVSSCLTLSLPHPSPSFPLITFPVTCTVISVTARPPSLSSRFGRMALRWHYSKPPLSSNHLPLTTAIVSLSLHPLSVSCTSSLQLFTPLLVSLSLFVSVSLMEPGLYG